MRSGYRVLAAALSLGVAVLASACSSASGAATSGSSAGDAIVAVGAENEYANVIAQVGGKYVQASGIMSNPNTDPHTFEASASVAREVSAAQLVVQNGVGYDTFMNTIEKAAPNSARKVIVVQNLLGLPTDTPNPHLWYLEAVVLSQFSAARPCDRKANRPPGQAALTERAALMGAEGLEPSVDLDQLAEVVRLAFPAAAPATAVPGAGVTA